MGHQLRHKHKVKKANHDKGHGNDADGYGEDNPSKQPVNNMNITNVPLLKKRCVLINLRTYYSYSNTQLHKFVGLGFQR